MNRSPKFFQSKQYDRCYEKVKQSVNVNEYLSQVGTNI